MRDQAIRHTDGRAKSVQAWLREQWGIELTDSEIHVGYLRPLTWKELATLMENGWDVGSHSLTHPDLTALTRTAVGSEVRDSRAVITQRLGKTPKLFSYPFGLSDATVRAEVAAAGYVGACTTLSRRVRPDDDPFALPRITVPQGLNIDEFAARICGLARRQWRF